MALVKYNNNSISAITAASSLPTGAMTLIKEQTASSSATISFVNGTSDVVLDNTYPIYLFKFINCHPATNAVNLSFQCSTNAGSSYGMTITNTYFRAYQYEDGSSGSGVGYVDAFDYAQSTSNIMIHENTGNDNDQSISGEMWLFNPSSTTYVKHYMTRTQNYNGSDITTDAYTAGYINSTDDVDAIKFLFSSGNIDSGTIKLYGIKDS